MDCHATLRARLRRAMEQGGPLLDEMIEMRQPLKAIEEMAYRAEVERWAGQRFYAALKQVAESL